MGACALQVGHQVAWISTSTDFPAFCAASNAAGVYAIVSAAKAAGVELRPLSSLADADRIFDVMTATWGEHQLLPRERIRALAESNSLARLRVLWLVGTRVTKQGAAELRKDLPQVGISLVSPYDGRWR